MTAQSDKRRRGRPPALRPQRHAHVEAFLEMMVAERGASRNTAASYGRDLDQFSSWLQACGRDPARSTAAEIKTWLAAQSDGAGGRAAGRTRARKLSALRQFHRFLVSEGHRADDPTSALDSPSLGRPLPKILSREEAQALIDAAASRSEAEGVRLLALMELLYGSGLRVSELVALPLSAIVGGGEALIIRGKGGRERLVPMTEPAREILAQWLQFRPIFIAPGRGGSRQAQWLFPSPTAEEGHLTRQRLGQLLKELSIEAGIDPGRVSPHVLRHAFATHMLAGGADLRSLQMLLGHADIATTELYTHVLDDRMRSVVERAHPLARPGPRRGRPPGGEGSS